jgi:hypothetical protein
VEWLFGVDQRLLGNTPAVQAARQPQNELPADHVW